MSDCQNPDTRWPAVEIMRRAREVDDTGLIPFVDTEAAARYLALSPHSLECYRSLGGGPPCGAPVIGATAAGRHGRTAGENARVY